MLTERDQETSQQILELKDLNEVLRSNYIKTDKIFHNMNEGENVNLAIKAIRATDNFDIGENVNANNDTDLSTVPEKEIKHCFPDPVTPQISALS